MNIIELAQECQLIGMRPHMDGIYQEALEKFAELVAAKERKQITKILNYLDMKAQPYHNYYKHAAVEINRKKGEGEKI